MTEYRLSGLPRLRRQTGFVLLALVFLVSGSLGEASLTGGMDDVGTALLNRGPEPSEQRSVGPNLTAAEMDLLARCISAESRGEPFKGQVAVGAVILNRATNPAFPNTVREVIYARNQFEVVRNGQINLRPTESAVAAAKAAAAGEDPTDGALYFFAPSKTRNAFLWSRPLKITIGEHRFTG